MQMLLMLLNDNVFTLECSLVSRRFWKLFLSEKFSDVEKLGFGQYF